MNTFRALAIPLLIFTFVPAYAKDKHAPLPDAFLKARTVYIDNQAGSAYFADRCYDELSKWGRYTVVTDPQKADLIFRLTSQVHVVGYAQNASATATNNGAYATGTSTAIRKGTTYLEVVDPTTNIVLWSDARGFGMFRSATRGIIKGLRDRVEESAADVRAGSIQTDTACRDSLLSFLRSRSDTFLRAGTILVCHSSRRRALAECRFTPAPCPQRNVQRHLGRAATGTHVGKIGMAETE